MRCAPPPPPTRSMMQDGGHEMDRPMRVSVKELVKNFSLLSDKALKEPLVIAKNGRDRLVLISVETYLLMRDMKGGATLSGGSVLDTAEKGAPHDLSKTVR
jgi:hypothetical protein